MVNGVKDAPWKAAPVDENSKLHATLVDLRKL
jgi:hypothetical protein